MVWKAVFVVLLAIGALAKDQLNDNYQRIEDKKTPYMVFSRCANTYIDLRTFGKEFGEANTMYSIKQLFKKYCPEFHRLKPCIRQVYSDSTISLTTTGRQFISTVYNYTNEIIEFTCYNDGERIASFITEGGPECLVQKSYQIASCRSRITSTMSSAELYSLSFQEQCRLLDEYSRCILSSLEDCPTRAATNLFESVLTLARKELNCTA